MSWPASSPPPSPSVPSSLLLGNHTSPVLVPDRHSSPGDDVGFNATECTWLEVILENLASEEAAERHGRDWTGKGSPPRQAPVKP